MIGLSRSTPIEVRIKLNVVIAENGCWLWQGSKVGNGYGSIYFNGKKELAHRVSWILYRGQIPEGHQVLHECDTPPCVNPWHLFTGTNLDNVQDCIQKGRFVTNRLSKLTVEQVLMIRQRVETESVESLACEYGITVGHAHDVIAGRKGVGKNDNAVQEIL